MPCRFSFCGVMPERDGEQFFLQRDCRRVLWANGSAGFFVLCVVE